ncbi:MAG: cheW 2 [Firmicutes bacterium]|nr:cheW 2 [Bacillota bacterium]
MVVFRLAREEYAIPIAQVKEIIRFQSATKLPNMPGYMEGIINLRGKVLPVIDLAGKFVLQTEKRLEKQALIVELGGKEMGLVVDSVTEVLRIDETAMEAAGTIAQTNRFIRAIGKVADRLLIILDLDTLFTAEETVTIQAAG